MRPPLRVAVLECDEPLPRTKERYGGYGPLFKELLEKGAKLVAEEGGMEGVGGVSGLGGVSGVQELDVTYYDVVKKMEEYPDLGGVDGVLVSGSKHNSFDNEPWIVKLVDFTRKVLRQNRVRLIGVCFGHQIIGRALDVKVGRSEEGWEVSVTPMALTDKGKEVFRMEKLAIHQMHRDIVHTYPDSVEALGHSDRCAVQGMYAKNRLITVQGHPEFTGVIVSEVLETRHGRGIFDDRLYGDGMRRVQDHHDGVQISAAFIRFLLEQDIILGRSGRGLER